MPEVPWREAKGIRDILAHAYQDVDVVQEAPREQITRPVPLPRPRSGHSALAGMLRSQLLYPLSYGRVFALRESGKRGICRCASTRVGADG